MLDPIVFEVAEASAIGEVRRAASTLAEDAGLTDKDIARLSLVITELGTNLIKHATRGTLLLGFSAPGAKTVEVLALDSGPGIANIGEALRDGHSTTATPGNGLGAVVRKADFFQIYSRSKHGTVSLARITASPGGRHKLDPVNTGGVSVPFPGETVNGDGWTEKPVEHGRRIMVVDGLGHGQLAHDAAEAACEAFQTANGSVSDTLLAIHGALRGTRGAAVAIAELDLESGMLRFAGVGNISATIVDPNARRSAVSLYGIVGHQMRESREYTYPWTAESTLIMHSDGLTTRWDLDAFPGLLGRDAVLIAAVLWKDYRRQSDDSTVVVARAS
ncbi:MAG TPA: ATP-binding protein [Thermoanaerobaculia bacterium]|nr:ATP-binding protein [Thermoanaerobaculia bacterium]